MMDHCQPGCINIDNDSQVDAQVDAQDDVRSLTSTDTVISNPRMNQGFLDASRHQQTLYTRTLDQKVGVRIPAPQPS